MIQGVEQGREGGLQLREVHDPAGLGVHRAGHVDPHLEGVVVQAGTLMAFRHVGETVGRLDMESLVDVHPPIIPCGVRRGKAPCYPIRLGDRASLW